MDMIAGILKFVVSLFGLFKPKLPPQAIAPAERDDIINATMADTKLQQEQAANDQAAQAQAARASVAELQQRNPDSMRDPNPFSRD